MLSMCRPRRLGCIACTTLLEAAQAEQARSTRGFGLVYSLEQSQRIQLAANRLQRLTSIAKDSEEDLTI